MIRFEIVQATGKILRSFAEWNSQQPGVRNCTRGNNPLLQTLVQRCIQVITRNLSGFYYVVKPTIPARIRLAVRHCIAMPLKWSSAAAWPINRACARKPANWPGWPEGKRFAFVLSHDVEGRKGLERCRSLAELEIRHGFRSSFNFVPEGEYETPAELRAYLKENGFEVGIHDLHHDGSLYISREAFEESAVKINQYLDDWNAAGFRSGFMRHDLDWIGKLRIRYDASTFDSDPFEPQPDGMKTIFPFWVQREDGSAYLELPYTLPQDSTLYLVLREKNNDVWKRKLSWIAEHGGMAFLIVHPDYLALDGKPAFNEYHVDRYREFLEFTRQQYGDTAWFARPCDVEQYLRFRSASNRKVEQLQLAGVRNQKSAAPIR